MENKLNNLLWLNDILHQPKRKMRQDYYKNTNIIKIKVFINIYYLEAEQQNNY
jgi:hypothetical protein